MNRHALQVIEYPAALELLAGRASSALGAEQLRAFAPRTDAVWLEREHSRVAVGRALLDDEAG
ncbi:MAG: hypothetical protein ABI875_04860, partial [Gemmatimonadales bacterium]